MRSLLAAVAIAASVTSASELAHAQSQPAPLPMISPIVGPPTVRWVFTQGDANGTAGDTHVPAFVFDPIRLGLLGDAFPQGSTDPACAGSIESTGNATAASTGAPMQHMAAIQLVPHLTLIGFSRGGCSIDGAAGGALVFTQPIRKDIWFVASAGALTVPNGGPNGRSVTHGQIRADVVFARPQGRSYTVGIGTRGLSFGGRL